MSTPPHAAEPDPVSFVPPTIEELGEMLPSYEVEALIASGGMGAVYKACQKDLDRMVAVKILPPEAGNDAESLNRFRSEARAMAKLNHPNIVSIYDFGVKEGQCYFVMEYVEGRNVHELIIDGQVTPEMALGLLSQVCEALSYAHSKGIIHGDIKPSNIVVNGEGEVKLLDFGLARLMEHEQSDVDAEWVPMGTPEYAAPELYERGAVADPRTDIYALGVVYYEMLMRTVPQGTFALPSTSLAVDGRVDDVIVRCLRPDPENRFQNASEVRQLLEDIRTGKPLVPVAPDLPKKSGRSVTIVRPSARRGTPPGGPITKGPGKGSRNRVAELEAEAKAKASSNKTMMIVIGAVVAAVIIVLAVMANSGEKPDPRPKAMQDILPKPEPGTTTPRPPDPPPVRPEPKVTKGPDIDTPVNPTPKPKPEEPKPEPKGPSVVAKLKEDFVGRYKTEIQSKLLAQQSELGEKYAAAMARLEPDFMARSDAKAVLEIRQEVERFQNKHTAPTGEEISKNAKIADLQKKLGTAFEAYHRAYSAPIAKLNGEFATAVKKLADLLATAGKKREAAEATAAFDKATQLPDYLGTLLEPPDTPKEETPEETPNRPEEPPAGRPDEVTKEGVISDGNIAEASHGANAEAPEKPEGMIDGSHSSKTATVGPAGSTFVLIFDKVYKIAQIGLHFTRGNPTEENGRKEPFSYRYTIEGTADGKAWKELVDATKEGVPGIKVFDIPPQPLKGFRILAKESTNENFFVIDEVGAWCEGRLPENWEKTSDPR